jgi:hypothetical protein
MGYRLTQPLAEANEIPARLSAGALHICGFQALVTGNDFKDYGFAFGQRLVSVAENGGMMHEDIPARILSNEAKAHFIVKPLNFATSHIRPDLRDGEK